MSAHVGDSRMRRAAMLVERLRGVLESPAVTGPKDRILAGAFWAGVRTAPADIAPVAPLWRARDQVSRPIG
jgi:hypothetical protein